MAANMTIINYSKILPILRYSKITFGLPNRHFGLLQL